MPPFLRSFSLDRWSFWLGFLAATLLWWLIGRLKPAFRALSAQLKEKAQATRQSLFQSTEIRLGNDTLRYAQKLHLASPFFSLDEILIAPRLLTPPSTDASETPAYDDITDRVFPFLPDWPELGSLYGAPSLSLAQALSGGAPIAVIGQPGSGKTVALAHLASLIINHDARCGELAQSLPLLIHACDLNLPLAETKNAFNTLVEAVSANASSLTLPRLPKTLEAALSEGRALLLLDGLDELPPAQLEETVAFISQLLKDFPHIKAAVAAAPTGLDGLIKLGFIPLPLAAWSERERSAFIENWSTLWGRLIAAPGISGNADPHLLSGWLATDSTPYTPFELTLKIWGLTAGDSLGPTANDAIEAYLRRMGFDAKGKPIAEARSVLEDLAGQMVVTLQPILMRDSTSPATGETEASESPRKLGKSATGSKGESPESGKTRTQRALLETGLLRSHIHNRLAITHPIFTGYLAACGLSMDGEQLLSAPQWTGRDLTLGFMASQDRHCDWLEGVPLESTNDILLNRLFMAARWLRYAPEGSAWQGSLLRRLVETLQNEMIPLGLRVRALAALYASGNTAITVLLRQLLQSPKPTLRQLAALGCGSVRDDKSVDDLAKLLVDSSPAIRRAACLALVNVGSKRALDAVAGALMHGDDDLRRAAAEALVNHPEEGHPTLEDGSTVEDVRVRRAVVYGLLRARMPWAREALERMQIQETQWVVQNAASESLDLLSKADGRIPRRLPPLHEAPWLIAYASERGIGVAPGKPAYELLLKALKDGSPDQRLLALNYLGRNPEEGAILPIYQVFFRVEDEETREASLQTLWNLSAAGISLPPPIQYGLR